ncbi:MAG: fumarylacetoacetase [Maricaulaceae bacterium]|jgi:fumarylacetoacetase
MQIDETHDASLRSWVASANGHPDFPIQNLPLGVFSPNGGDPRVGVAIGDHILDVAAALDAGLFTGEAETAARLCQGQSLNALMAAEPSQRRALRRAISSMLADGAEARAKIEVANAGILHKASSCELMLPANVGDYTDFFAGIHHAVGAGAMFRPDNPLLPNYKYVPIAYHSRASTVGAAPARVRRPNGQLKAGADAPPAVGPSKKLDYEFELGVWIRGGNPQGEPIPIADAGDAIFGYCILNDWSARDIQRWEAQPLGPFLAKSFATTVSPWIITPEAMAPFRAAQPARPSGDPAPLPYMLDANDQAHGALDIQLEVLVRTPQMRDDGVDFERISATDALQLYWTPAQMVAHHTVNGCALRAGDIFGTGTISGQGDATAGCLLEQTLDGTRPVTLKNGEQRRYLEDGDEVLLRARCHRDGFVSIGFGDNRCEILPASS